MIPVFKRIHTGISMEYLKYAILELPEMQIFHKNHQILTTYSNAILGIFEQSLATSRSSTRIRHSEPLAKTCHPKDGSKNLPVPVPILDFHNHFDSS